MIWLDRLVATSNVPVSEDWWVSVPRLVRLCSHNLVQSPVCIKIAIDWIHGISSVYWMWCTMEFIEFTSFRLLVEFYQLFKGPEIDVVINVELSALILLNAIVTHFVVVPVHDKTNMQYDSLIPRLLWRFAGFELTVMTMHTCFPQKIRFSPENSLPSPVIQYTLHRRDPTPWATTSKCSHKL